MKFTLQLALYGLTLFALNPVSQAQDLGTVDLDFAIPNRALIRPDSEATPVVFISRGLNAKEWDTLKEFATPITETIVDPVSKKMTTRKVVKIKMPLGLNTPPSVPPENPLTWERFELGKKLYFDTTLSSNGTVSCATCHDPDKGFSDAGKTSKGIHGKVGGMNAPTVLNAGFNRFQFWDGRACTLEEQSQGPVQNVVEMFDGKGNAWNEAVKRLRNKPEYKGVFEREFGTPATRDAIAKAIATYERLVMAGNSIQDRTELAARVRAIEDDSTNFTPKVEDYEKVLKEAFTKKDKHALAALQLTEETQIPELAKSIERGRVLFLNKARCNSCHVGETYTDHTFHNLGVGVGKDGKLPADQLGRYAALATGHKDNSMIGSFKTPPLRGLLASKPYMHDGSEKTLAEVIEFYDKGGNANEFLDAKMRDTDAEAAYIDAIKKGTKYEGPAPALFASDKSPIIPRKLGLTAPEKKDLENFMRALEGEELPAILHAK